MSKTIKIVIGIVLLPILFIGVYILFLWATYIDNTVTQGSKYGFTIGASIPQTHEDILITQKENPKLMMYISYGPRAGDYMTLLPTRKNFEIALESNHWQLLLDGKGAFFNIIKLKVKGNKLTEIHRHRKYFELP